MPLVTAGTINRTEYIYIVGDASNASPGDPITGLLFSDIETGGSASYMRQGAVRTDFTLVTQTVAGAHTDGGFVEVDATNMPGTYRIDVPDAAYITGVDFTIVQVVVAASNNAEAAPLLVDITDVDLRDGVRGGMTALPDAAADGAGGLPISDVGGLDMDTIGSEVTSSNTGITQLKGAGFVEATDSNEALRNRGDSAWTGGQTLMDSGTATAGSSTTITLEAGFNTNDDIHNGQLVTITAGTGLGQSRAISDNPGYNGTTGVATIIGTWAINPDNTSVYEITPADIDEITAAPTVGAIADAVLDENLTGHSGSNTVGEKLSVDIPAILVDTAEIQSDQVNGGRLDLIWDAILADTVEIGAAGAGLTNINLPNQTMDITGDLSGSVGSVTGAVGSVTGHTNQTGDTFAIANGGAGFVAIDTVVDAIKLITDQMVFTKANELDVNAQSLNGATIVGDGNATPWDGA